MFPSEQVELPSADKFNAFPPEAQKVLLAAFEREQIERHAWLKNQQSYDHRLNLETEGNAFRWRMTGTIVAGILTVSALLVGGWLVNNGSSGIGAASMFFAIATLVGTAVYGQRAASKPPPDDNEPQRDTRPAVTKTDGD